MRLFWFHFSFEKGIIFDTLTDCKRKMKTKEAVQIWNLLFYRFNHKISIDEIHINTDFWWNNIV